MGRLQSPIEEPKHRRTAVEARWWLQSLWNGRAAHHGAEGSSYKRTRSLL